MQPAVGFQMLFPNRIFRVFFVRPHTRRALSGTHSKTLERQGWRDRALHGRIYGRVLEWVPDSAPPLILARQIAQRQNCLIRPLSIFTVGSSCESSINSSGW